ncbi:MFS transporter [bacterium]|nr:MFS transporter [bacterium]MBU1638217.1 MFS transporter [bacterium]
MKQVFQAFSHRNYRLYWYGFTLSLMGTWMQQLAQGWLVWRLTESTLWLGIIGAMPQLPSLLLGSIGGVLVDRTHKRKVLFITQTGIALTALALAYLTITEQVTPMHILVISAIAGVFMAVDAPARLSFVSDLVGEEDIGNAVALNSSTFNATRLVGPAVAGIIIPFVGEGMCFLINAVTFGAMIIGLSLMRNLPGPSADSREPIFKQLRDAYCFVKAAPVQRVLIRNVIVFAAFGFSYMTLMPAFADAILNVGVRGLGWMMGSIGIGALIGGLWQASLPKGTKRGPIVMLGMAGMGCGLLVFSLSPWFTLSILALGFLGFSGISMLASTNTLLQTLTPDHLRGRVLGFYTSAFLGFLPFGSFAIGAVAEHLGAPVTLAISAVICIAVALYTIFHYHRLRVV